MSSAILIGEQYLNVANRRLFSLVVFALQVGGEVARTDEERGYVARLKNWDELERYPGCDFDLGKRFPTLGEKKFWAGCFFTVARRIFRREIGDQAVQTWQPSAIGDAYVTARMLVRAVQEETGTSWQPGVEDQEDAQEQSDRIRIRL